MRRPRSAAEITLPTSQYLELGPISLAWHGLFTALGVLVAMAVTLRYARERGLDADLLVRAAIGALLAGFVGSRLFYLIEQDPSALLSPGEWLSSTGFSFYGALIAAIPVALLLLKAGERLRSLDALAVGFGLGMAVGRIGDLLIGEHLGSATAAPWGFRYSNPGSLAPSLDLAYHPGPLYESLLGLLIFVLVWTNRGRFTKPGLLVCAVVGLYAVGRFGIFFFREDSPIALAGLSSAQVTSIAVAVAAVMSAFWIRSRRVVRQ